MSTKRVVIRSTSGAVLYKAPKGTEPHAALETAVVAGVDLRRANLRGADLSGANLHEADLRKADLTKANLSRTDLTGSDLRGANMSEANMSKANLRVSDLRGADLIEADFTGSDLRGAELSRADLTRADLHNANLNDAILKDAILTGATISTGETWETYLAETVPALLTAGGHHLEDCVPHWTCHSWRNCPIAWAFDVHRLNDVPRLYRPRAEQFVQFFDAGLIPCPIL